MEFLRLLEDIRTSVLDSFFSFITHFGGESVFLVLGFALFWCISKKQGYYVLFVGFLGLLSNQFLKITFRIPRPWVLDKNFTIVESARAEATGYSFPSGHTQISVGTYASLAKANKNALVKAICISLCVLVPFSRMYLGVHTPLDVLTSVAIALLLTFTLRLLVEKALESKAKMRFLFLAMVGLSFLFVLYMTLFPFPDSTDSANLRDATENSYKIFGAIIGVWLGYEIDERHIHFTTQAKWWAQIAKLILGLLPVLLIKSLLKAPLTAVFGSLAAGTIRYFLIALFACGVWPFTFRFFNKLGTKK